MNIRKFEAGSFQEALNRVKVELGPDALILASEEKSNGWFQKPTIEITAAFHPDPDKDFDDHALERIFPHRRQTSALDAIEAQAPKKPAKREVPTSITPRERRQANLTSASVEESLLEMGLSPEVCRDFARQIIFDFPKKDREDGAFLEKIKIKLIAAGVKTLPADVFQSRRAWAAVGAPGAGKTSFLVKLALYLKGAKQSVALTTCDNRKIVGRHELMAYAKLITVPFLSHRASERKADQVTLLDTPSLGSSAAHFKEVEKHCRDFSTVVVLDASARLNELLATVDRLSRLAPVGLAFTRLDLVSQAGVVYDVLKQTKLPLLGLSVSPGFSTAVRFHEPVSLARYIVRKTREGEAQREIIEAAAEGARESAI